MDSKKNKKNIKVTFYFNCQKNQRGYEVKTPCKNNLRQRNGAVPYGYVQCSSFPKVS